MDQLQNKNQEMRKMFFKNAMIFFIKYYQYADTKNLYVIYYFLKNFLIILEKL